MPRVDVFQAAGGIEYSEKHCGVALELRVFTNELVDVRNHAGGLLSDHGTGELALQHRGQQGRPKTLAGDVRDEKGSAVRAEIQHVEVVAAHRQAGLVEAGQLQVGAAPEFAGQQRLLNLAGDTQLLSQALPLALVFDQPGVVNHAGGFHRQGVQDLPLQAGKRRRTPAVEVKDTEQLAAGKCL